MVKVKGESIVIFGGSGFIGSHLAERLISLGAFVTVADKDIPGFFFRHLTKKFDFKKIDILKDKNIKSILRKKKYVFNLAASLPFSSNQYEYLRNSIDINLKGAVNIACACKDIGVKKLIFISGYVVYGVPEYLPMDESHPTQPIDLYGASKLAAEKYLQIISRHGLELIILRLSSVYGPGQKTKGLIPNLIRAALEKSSILMYAGGREKRDYVFIDDAVTALILSLRNGVAGTFNIGSNECVPSNRIKSIIEGLSGKPIKSKYITKKGFIQEVILSNKLARKYLGYEPKISIKDGLNLTYQWYKDNYASIMR